MGCVNFFHNQLRVPRPMSVLICQRMLYLSNWGSFQFLEHDLVHVLQNNNEYTIITNCMSVADLDQSLLSQCNLSAPAARLGQADRPVVQSGEFACWRGGKESLLHRRCRYSRSAIYRHTWHPFCCSRVNVREWLILCTRGGRYS